MAFEPRIGFPLKQFETATSYVSRLTRFFHVETPHDFCLDHGFRWQDVVRGDDVLLDRVARIAGACSADLKHWAVRSTGSRRFVVAGQEGIKSSLIRSRLRVCPQCLVADRIADLRHGAYRRHFWQFAAMRACRTHRCPIITLPHERYTIHNYDFAGQVERHWDLITGAASECAHQSATDLEAYVMSRLMGKPCNPFLDAMPMHIATRLSEVLGFVLLFGPKRLISSATEPELAEAGQAGFDALQAGEEGLCKALESLVAPEALRTVHHKSDLGALFEWLRTSALGEAFEPLKDIVRDFIFCNYPIQEGQTVLGKACTSREKYTVHTAWQTLGMQRNRMNRVLLSGGQAQLDDEDKSIRLKEALDAKDVAQIAAQMEGRLTAQQASARLAVSTEVLQQFKERSILTPIIDALDLIPKYERADIGQLLARLSHRVTVRGASHAKLVPIVEASQRVRCPSADIVSFILDGHLQTIGHDSAKDGLSGFRICIGELRSLLPVPELPGLPKGDAARALRVTYPTIKHLVDLGLLTEERAMNPKSRQPITVITFESITAFSAKYVTLGELAKEYRRAAGPLGCHLEAKGICPIETPPKVSWYYERHGLRMRLDAIGLKAPVDHRQKRQNTRRQNQQHQEARL
ncbi:MAG: TniQ family protein [Paracoccaceae bacterium]|uniref:TniQ family protein n=1 Tax=Yoonia sp. TaxID=2212373 RepID=UPI0032709361